MNLFGDEEFPEKNEIKLGGKTQTTSIIAAEILLSMDMGFHIPTRTQKKNMLIAFAERGFSLNRKAFDIVRLEEGDTLKSLNEIRRCFERITLYEIKSTGKENVKEDFTGYFFSISMAEILMAQNLHEKYRFAFVNTLTKEWRDFTLQEIYSKAKGIYPTWSIQF